MLPKLIVLGSNAYIPSYGVIVAAAFIVAIMITGRLAERAGLNREKISNLAIYCAIAGMLGAKLFMILFDLGDYLSHPGQIFTRDFLQAAGVFQGGLLAAIIVAVWYMRVSGLPLLKTMDVFAPGIAIGHAIGRLGCFAAGCCWGDQCDLPWAVTFRNPDAHELTGVPLNTPLHPTQLYESIANVILFVFLWRYAHRPHREGTVMGWYLAAYSVVRFAIEFVRNHEQALVLGLSLTQWISLGTLAAGLWLIRRPAIVRPATPAAAH